MVKPTCHKRKGLRKLGVHQLRQFPRVHLAVATAGWQQLEILHAVTLPTSSLCLISLSGRSQVSCRLEFFVVVCFYDDTCRFLYVHGSGKVLCSYFGLKSATCYHAEHLKWSHENLIQAKTCPIRPVRTVWFVGELRLHRRHLSWITGVWMWMII